MEALYIHTLRCLCVIPFLGLYGISKIHEKPGRCTVQVTMCSDKDCSVKDDISQVSQRHVDREIPLSCQPDIRTLKNLRGPVLRAPSVIKSSSGTAGTEEATQDVNATGLKEAALLKPGGCRQRPQHDCGL